MGKNDREKFTEFQKSILKRTVEIYEKMNISVEQLLDDFRRKTKSARDSIYIEASSSGKKELANKIKEADNIVAFEEIIMAENDSEKFTEFQRNILEITVEIYEKMDISVEQLLDDFRGKKKLVRNRTYTEALSSGKKELANKIGKVNDIIALEEVDVLLQIIQVDKEKNILKNILGMMNYKQKIVFQDAIEYTIPKVKERTLTEEEKTAFSILETSIEEEIAKYNKKHALIAGFDNVEAWKEHLNNKIYINNSDHEKTK